MPIPIQPNENQRQTPDQLVKEQTDTGAKRHVRVAGPPQEDHLPVSTKGVDGSCPPNEAETENRS